MNQLTLWRFSKQTGIPQENLNPEVVKLLVGDSKDLKTAHNHIDKFYVLRDEAVKYNVSFQEMLEFIRSHK